VQEIVDMIGLDFLNIQVCSISLQPAGASLVESVQKKGHGLPPVSVETT